MPRIKDEIWDPKKKMLVVPGKSKPNSNEEFLKVPPIKRQAKMVPMSEKQKQQMMAMADKTQRKTAKVIISDEHNEEELTRQKKDRLKYLAKK